MCGRSCALWKPKTSWKVMIPPVMSRVMDGMDWEARKSWVVWLSCSSGHCALQATACTSVLGSVCWGNSSSHKPLSNILYITMKIWRQGHWVTYFSLLLYWEREKQQKAGGQGDWWNISFDTDCIPTFLITYFPKGGVMRMLQIVHDYFLKKGLQSRQKAALFACLMHLKILQAHGWRHLFMGIISRCTLQSVMFS